MKSSCNEAKAGMLLYNSVYCKKCENRHQQWKYPCSCENGKIPVEPLGYKLCNACMGRGYLK